MRVKVSEFALLLSAVFSIFVFGDRLAAAPRVPLMAQEVAGWDAFVASDFQRALSEGEAGDTVESLVIACRSATVLGGYLSDGEEAVAYLHQAVPLCERALARNPDHMIGRMTYALLLSFESKRIKSPRLGKAALRNLEWVRDRYPERAMAHAGVAGWHSEVFAEGLLARIALGPSLKKARAGYKTALEMGVTNIPLLIEYAKHLSRGDKDERAEAVVVLKKIISLEPAEGFDEIVQGKAALLLAAVETGKKKDIKRTIKAIGAFKGIEKFGKIDGIDFAFAGKNPAEAKDTKKTATNKEG